MPEVSRLEKREVDLGSWFLSFQAPVAGSVALGLWLSSVSWQKEVGEPTAISVVRKPRDVWHALET